LVPPSRSSDGHDPDRPDPGARSESGDGDGDRPCACSVQMAASSPERSAPPSDSPFREPSPSPNHGLSSIGRPHGENPGGL
jgi:hypothetical protein